MKKKGFTLVELLCVIAILAILVIIALPNILSMFNSAKKSSFETELKSVYTAAEERWINDTFSSSGTKIYAHCLSGTCSNELKLNGRDNLEYYIEFDTKGNIVKYYAKDGSYQYSYEGPGLKKDGISDVELTSTLDDFSKIEITCDGVSEPQLPEGDPTQGTYYNPYQNQYYTSLKDAFDGVGNNQIIKMLNDSPSNETANVTLAAGKTGVKFDLNGKKLKLGSKSLTNNGDLDIYNSSTTASTITTSSSFTNSGTLKINGTSTNGKLSIGCDIRSTGTLVINDNSSIYDSGTYVIYLTSGTAHVTGGRISAGNTYDYDSNGIYVSANAELTVSGDSTTIYGGSASNISGIINYGVTTINGGDISGPHGVSNYGTLTINNGTIHGDYGLYNSGTLIMKDASVSGDTYGVYNIGANTNATITGGSITGGTRYSWSMAINNSSSSTMTIGDNSTSVNTNSPLIEAKSSSGYAISNAGTLNFYDGRVIAKTDKTFGGSVTPTIPNGYQIYKEVIDSKENAYLVQE